MLLWRRAAVPAFLGVLGLIWLAAHALAHDVVARPRGSGHAAHGTAVESYAAYLPTSLALCLTLAIAIAAGLALGRRWTGRSGRSIWLFGIVPVLGFAADTLVELPARRTTAPVAELVPVLLVGLLIQIPFALVAVALAVKILWLVERLAWALRDAPIVGPPEAGSLGEPAPSVPDTPATAPAMSLRRKADGCELSDKQMGSTMPLL
jgi:hypothetical protein